MMGTQTPDVFMSMYQSIATAAATASDRFMGALVSGLELEFGRGAGEALTQGILEAEAADLRWDARDEERWIRAYNSPDDEDFGLDRIAICGRLDGRWFCATMLVDGDGRSHGMMSCREFRSFVKARNAMLHAH
jgi:hypothetical protein